MKIKKMIDGHLPSIILIIIFIFCSALFSGAETAFTCLNRNRLKTMIADGSRMAKTTLQLFDRHDEILSTVLIGDNVVNVAMASVSAVLFVSFLPRYGASVSTLVITVLVLIFGEISPKSIAREYPERFAVLCTPVMWILIKILKPINYLLSGWQKMLRKIFKVSGKQEMTPDELSMFVEDAAQQGIIDEEEEDLLQSAIAFEGQTAEDVITPRVDIIAVDADASDEEVRRLFRKYQYSRLPVYEGSIDHIVGILYEKDFYAQEKLSERPVRKLMREPVFIPNTMMIDDILRFFRERKAHIAVVTDEFGGTMGIVTMEDVLEELVGEIYDEHDNEVEIYKRIDEDTFRIIGSADMDQLEKYMGEKLESDGSSAGGWVIEQMGFIPCEGEGFRYKNFNVTVTRSDGNRVAEIEIHRNDDVSSVRE